MEERETLRGVLEVEVERLLQQGVELLDKEMMEVLVAVEVLMQQVVAVVQVLLVEQVVVVQAGQVEQELLQA